MRYKEELKLILRCYTTKQCNFEETIDNLLSAYSRSKYFNYHNFMLGFMIGGISVFILISILK